VYGAGVKAGKREAPDEGGRNIDCGKKVGNTDRRSGNSRKTGGTSKNRQEMRLWPWPTPMQKKNKDRRKGESQARRILLGGGGRLDERNQKEKETHSELSGKFKTSTRREEKSDLKKEAGARDHLGQCRLQISLVVQGGARNLVAVRREVVSSVITVASWGGKKTLKKKKCFNHMWSSSKASMACFTVPPWALRVLSSPLFSGLARPAIAFLIPLCFHTPVVVAPRAPHDGTDDSKAVSGPILRLTPSLVEAGVSRGGGSRAEY